MRTGRNLVSLMVIDMYLMFPFLLYIGSAHDVVLVDESRARVNRKLELWRRTLESRKSSDLVGPRPST